MNNRQHEAPIVLVHGLFGFGRNDNAIVGKYAALGVRLRNLPLL